MTQVSLNVVSPLTILTRSFGGLVVAGNKKQKKILLSKNLPFQFLFNLINLCSSKNKVVYLLANHLQIYLSWMLVLFIHLTELSLHWNYHTHTHTHALTHTHSHTHTHTHIFSIPEFACHVLMSHTCILVTRWTILPFINTMKCTVYSVMLGNLVTAFSVGNVLCWSKQWLPWPQKAVTEAEAEVWCIFYQQLARW